MCTVYVCEIFFFYIYIIIRLDLCIYRHFMIFVLNTALCNMKNKIIVTGWCDQDSSLCALASVKSSACRFSPCSVCEHHPGYSVRFFRRGISCIWYTADELMRRAASLFISGVEWRKRIKSHAKSDLLPRQCFPHMSNIVGNLRHLICSKQCKNKI